MNKGGFPKWARAVYRSNNNANANGGVSYANSWNDAANANANIGSRLANNEFRKFGVQHGERVPKAVPMGMSHSNSATSGKLEKTSVRRSIVGVEASAEMVRPRKLKGNK